MAQRPNVGDRLVNQMMNKPHPTLGVKQLMEARRQAMKTKYQKAYFEVNKESPTKYKKGLTTGVQRMPESPVNRKRPRSPVYEAVVRAPNPYGGTSIADRWGFAAPMKQPKL